MSARLATATRLGGAEETYPTPAWCVHRLLDEIDLPRGGYWLEPAVGDGAIVRAIRGREEYTEVKWWTNDVRDVGADVTSDYQTWGVPANGRIYDVVITNPPFSLARSFVDISRTL